MQLCSDRLVYRPLESGDWEDVLRYRGDPSYPRYRETDPSSPEEMRAFVNRFLLWEGEEPQRRFAFGVSLIGSPAIIGICSLRRETVEATDAEIGFELAMSYWGQGLGIEMGTKMLWLGFEGLGLHRIGAQCISDNIRSRRVLERIGMRLEGRLRERQFFDGRFYDELWFGMLRPEWIALQGKEDLLISGAA